MAATLRMSERKFVCGLGARLHSVPLTPALAQTVKFSLSLGQRFIISRLSQPYFPFAVTHSMNDIQYNADKHGAQVQVEQYSEVRARLDDELSNYVCSLYLPEMFTF